MKRFLALLSVWLLFILATSGAEPGTAPGVWAAQEKSQQEKQEPKSGDEKPRDLKEKQEAPRGRTSIRVNVEQVSVDATVMDKSGNLIKGLTAEHFKIYEDKVE